MERLFSVTDICTRYQCKAATARKYMRDMAHMEKPLMVSERAVADWERRRTLPPESDTRQLLRKGVKR
jgi:DNA-binding transcriptional regulator YiaG